MRVGLQHASLSIVLPLGPDGVRRVSSVQSLHAVLQLKSHSLSIQGNDLLPSHLTLETTLREDDDVEGTLLLWLGSEGIWTWRSLAPLGVV